MQLVEKDGEEDKLENSGSAIALRHSQPCPPLQGSPYPAHSLELHVSLPWPSGPPKSQQGQVQLPAALLQPTGPGRCPMLLAVVWDQFQLPEPALADTGSSHSPQGSPRKPLALTVS